MDFINLYSDYDAFFKMAMGLDTTPFHFQRLLAESEELPSVIEVPTGSGKTAAAVLAWIYRRKYHRNPLVRQETPRRLIYCLPMRSLVDQTYKKTVEMIDNLGLSEDILVSSLMGGGTSNKWFMQPHQDQIIIGTQDMLVSRALNRGYGMSKTSWGIPFGLLNNDCLWILDEVQLMGPSLPTLLQLQAFRNKMGTFKKTQTVLMSATIDDSSLSTIDYQTPRGSKLILTDYDLKNAELMKRGNARKVKRVTRFSIADDDYSESISDYIYDVHEHGTLTVFICNRVKRAQEVYQKLNDSPRKTSDVVLLHSRFREIDKGSKRERLSTKCDKDLIVVATQVIEAGMDISAKNMIVEAAPWPSMVQRFGRCNRFGEYAESTISIITEGLSEEPTPYEKEEIEESIDLMGKLSDLSVDNLKRVSSKSRNKNHPVLRKRDLLELFETSSDISGKDIDVSRYIREDRDKDVFVYWRKITGDEPDDSHRHSDPSELCRVSLTEIRRFLGKGERRVRAWSYDPVKRKWNFNNSSRIKPGQKVLIGLDGGGYSLDKGWTGNRKDVLDEELGFEPQIEEKHDDSRAYSYIEISEHSDNVLRKIRSFCYSLGLDGEIESILESSAINHDIGKAHPAFQMAIGNDSYAVSSGKIWAKGPAPHLTPTRGGLDYRFQDKNGNVQHRRHFRHELISAIYTLMKGPEGKDTDLKAWVVGSHHGQIGLRIRSLDEEAEPSDDKLYARGVWDGDEIPPIPTMGIPSFNVDMGFMEMGKGGWSHRCYRLRDDPDIGPFRMAYLSSLLRIADWSASEEEGQENAEGGI